MSTEPSLPLLIARTLHGFGARGLELIDVEDVGRGAWRARFDLDGHRLHLPFDTRTSDVFALELRDALFLDDAHQPGVLATGRALVDVLHERVPHVRYVLRPVRVDADGDAWVDAVARSARALDEPVPAPREVLVSLHFSAPLLGPLDDHLEPLVEVGLDALFYALGRLHDGLEARGFGTAGAIRPL